MADYIKRDDTINAIERLPTWWADEGGYYGGMQQPRVALLEPEDVINAIKNIPSADVAEVRHGKWEVVGINTYELSYGGTAYEPFYRCSKCKMITESYLRLDEPIMPEDASFPNFCPNCGARMDGKEINVSTNEDCET